MFGGEQTTVIAGLDGRREASLPDWFAAQHPDAEPVTFTRAIRELPRVTTTELAYRNPYSGEWNQTDQHVALVEPSRLVATDARANAIDLREPNLWTLHSGATYALTHQFRGGDGSALQQYTQLANDLLFNPEATIDRVEAAYERQLEADSEDQQSLDGSTARVQFEEVREDLAAKADQFEQCEQRLRERLAGDEGG